MTGRDHKINKTGLKQGHLQHLHVSKEVPTRHHYGEIPKTLSRESTCRGASLKCPYANARSMGNKREESEMRVQLQGYDLVGITETWWDGSRDWSVAMEGYGQALGRTGWEDEEGEWPFYVREQLECMEPWLGRADEPTESLWVRLEEKTGKGGIVVGVCYRPPDQEEQADEALYRQIGAAWHLQALVLTGDFNHPDICWRDNTAGHKQSRRFLERVDDNFLTQVIEVPTRRGALLDLLLTDKEGLVGDAKVKGSLGCSDHEMVEFRIPRGG